MNTAFRILIIAGSIILSGCATYGAGMSGAITDLQKGDYQASEAAIKQALKPTGKDRFLYYVELATVKYLEGDFNTSNELLTTAQQISEELETIRLKDTLVSLMSNPRLTPYAGAEFERIFINYYKALNYFGLAQIATTENARLDAIEGARIEARQLNIRLNDLNDRKGNYAEQKDEDEKTFASVLSLLSKVLRGNLVDMNSIRYRDDAMAHYLSAISFEMNGDFDDARISYQKAATAYEDGYAKQYKLGDEMIAQSWFDTIRMMRRAGGYDSEWRALAATKLNDEQRAELELWNRDTAQVIVLEHKGLIPHRKEMNLFLSANPDIQSLQLRPYFVSTRNTAEVQWFYMLYADKGVAGVVTAYLDAVTLGFPMYGFTKTVYLGPLWKQLEDLGVVDSLYGGMRVTVPYYDPVTALGDSTLNVNGALMPMMKSSNPALIAVQEQMTKASSDIYLALARGITKARASKELERVGNYGALLSVIGNVTAQLSDAAETRNWLLLPQDIRLRRVRLEPGEHQLDLHSDMPGGTKAATHSFTLEPGEIHFWRVRTLPLLGHTAPSK